MQVVEKPKTVIRVRVDEFLDGKNLSGGEAIHLTDTTVNEVYLIIVKALGVQDQVLHMKKREEEKTSKRGAKS